MAGGVLGGGVTIQERVPKGMELQTKDWVFRVGAGRGGEHVT